MSDAKADAIVEMNMRAVPAPPLPACLRTPAAAEARLQMVKMSAAVLPGMLEAGNGAIVNIGSAAGSCADPFYSVRKAGRVASAPDACSYPEPLLYRSTLAPRLLSRNFRSRWRLR